VYPSLQLVSPSILQGFWNRLPHGGSVVVVVLVVVLVVVVLVLELVVVEVEVLVFVVLVDVVVDEVVVVVRNCIKSSLYAIATPVPTISPMDSVRAKRNTITAMFCLPSPSPASGSSPASRSLLILVDIPRMYNIYTNIVSMWGRRVCLRSQTS
jgi:hypothetical protein